MRHTIRNGRALLPSGELKPCDIGVVDGVIEVVAPGADTGAHAIDADGLLVLPGIVDIHGDAFERQIMPRPGVPFPLDVALIDSDRQLLANGVTTTFHALTCSWEPGLRGRDMAIAFLDRLDTLAPQLGCDTRLHLRFETFNLAMLDEIDGWLQEGRVDLLAFNDHFDAMHRKRGDLGVMRTYAERGQVEVADFIALLDAVAAGAPDVPKAIERLAATARRQGIALASHDDKSAAQRRAYHALGCTICEFPVTREAIDEANRLGNPVIMGAPNVLRGGSHLGLLDAATAVAAGQCSILASDYFYPALYQAAFRLAREGKSSLGDAWALVSRGPARAAGLADRGEIAVGQRADLVLVDPSPAEPPRLLATLVAGEPAHIAGGARRFRL